MILALFDLDNTLLAGDSDFEWAQFLIDRGVLDREVYEARNQEFYDQYKAGTLDIRKFLDFQLKPLSRHPRKVLDEWHADYMRSRILPMIRQSARDLVAAHAGETRVLITATNSFVTAPIAREFGIEHLIATRSRGPQRRIHRWRRRHILVSAKARSRGWKRGWPLTNRALKVLKNQRFTAIPTMTCLCWSRSPIRSRSTPMPVCARRRQRAAGR